MMAVGALIIIQFMLMRDVLLFNLRASLGAFLDFLYSLDPFSLAYLAFTKIFIIGQVWIWFFRVDPVQGMTYCPFRGCDSHNGSSFLLNHVTFTVAIEATFYLISPFLLRQCFRWALALCVLGFTYHLFVRLAGLNSLVWGYHFVGSAAFFYFLGACTYHAYARWAALPADSRYRRLIGRLEWPLCAAALPLALAARAYGLAERYALALLLAAIIPLLFQRTKSSRVDRFTGELSLGIYLVHYPLYLLLADSFDGLTAAILTTLLVVPAAVLLYVTVERPIDRWRQRRVPAPAGRDRPRCTAGHRPRLTMEVNPG